MDALFIVLSVLILSVGIALFFVGSLVSLSTALGNRHWYWAAVMLFFLPASIAYCWVHGHIAAWPRKLVTIGGVLLLVGVVVLTFPQMGLTWFSALTGSSIGPTTAGQVSAILHNWVRRCGPLTADVKSLMPYELTFTKVVPIADRDQYFNECCVGGDVVMDQLLPGLRTKYDDIETNQEDWGWFAWFKEAGSNLAVDVFSDNPDAGEFRIHLTSNVPRFLFGAKVIDTPELEPLLGMVVEAISKWTGQPPQVVRLDAKHMPLAKAT